MVSMGLVWMAVPPSLLSMVFSSRFACGVERSRKNRLSSPLSLCPCLVFNRGSFEPWDALEACGRYVVDPASSHMLVSKIKPCMSKYELIQTVKLRMAH